ncbi:MAG: HU family DNA-binding protein [bacterium]
MNEKFTKKDISKELSKRTGLLNKDAKKLVDIFFNSIIEELLENGKVNIRGFGTFKMVLSRPKIARDINKNEPIRLPSYYRVKFIPSRLFIEKLNDEI